MRQICIFLFFVCIGFYCCSQVEQSGPVQLPTDKDPIDVSAGSLLYNEWFQTQDIVSDRKTLNYFVPYSAPNLYDLEQTYKLVLFINLGSERFHNRSKGAIKDYFATDGNYTYTLKTCAPKNYAHITIYKN